MKAQTNSSVSTLLKNFNQKSANENDPLSKAFAKELFSRTKHADLELLPLNTLTDITYEMWAFYKERPTGQSKVHLHHIKLGADQGGSRIIINLANDNMPFLVDSVMGYFRHIGLRCRVLMRTLFTVERDAKGHLKRFCDPDTPGAIQESFIHCEITDTLSKKEMAKVKQDLSEIHGDVRLAVNDWKNMRSKIHHAVGDLKSFSNSVEQPTVDEISHFLEWMDQNHFTFLGYKEYDLRSREDAKAEKNTESLGILKGKSIKEVCEAYHGTPLNKDTFEFLSSHEPVLVTKTTKVSTVHRAVPMDSVSIKQYDKHGNVIGMRQFVGLFTSTAYSSSAREIPLLRQKVSRVVHKAGFKEEWHDGKVLTHIMDTLPRDELFQATDQELLDVTTKVRSILEEPKVAFFARKDRFNRYLSCFTFIPEDWFDYELTEQVARVLEKEFGCAVAIHSSEFGMHAFARIHHMVHLNKDHEVNFSTSKIEKKLTRLARSWRDHLRHALIDKHGEWHGLQLMKRYGHAFNKGYQERFSEIGALKDIDYIETVLAQDKSQVRLYRPPKVSKQIVKLKLYSHGTPIPLSDVIPTLENMDLRVLGEIPFSIHPAESTKAIWIHDFEMESRSGQHIDIETVRENFLELFQAVCENRVENDGFNRLVLRAGLRWQECQMFRAYAKYLRQLRAPFSFSFMEQTLVNHGEITRQINDFFLNRFYPGKSNFNEEKELAKILESIEQIDNPDEDRLFHSFLNLIMSTVRTNYYQTEKGQQKPYLSFKVDCSKVEHMPLPRPMYEIFVYSPDFEAVHLRGGKVARGGLRWSDRREDFRTEILGLVKAQMVKNAVIVPTGSKGGFVIKKSMEGLDRTNFMKVGVHYYQQMISALLEITDNLSGDKVVPPQKVKRFDDNDPYLVVAADKGTATFSDFANAISEEKGFWLGDAFASGGSQGYDHKKMGITARGAWEAVKHHFHTLGVNVDTQEITAVGVGDMSGDVFGNGVLLSKHLKLQAAFNHRHIFIDPNPDPKTTYKERQRCFKNRLGWDGYDQSLLSKGGMIYERSAKRLKLTPEIKAFTGLTKDEVRPNDLIKALLKAHVDLIWFGGIGTYVKSKKESDADVGDRANDAVRIDASDLNCRSLGEGANLGITQLARIEFARQGGSLNTDAIDNSAGVDCSDHEVNIKILLKQIVDKKKLSNKKRNLLLEDMTDEVSDLVLEDNKAQNLAITMIRAQGPGMLDQQTKLMRRLEKEGILDRGLEFLPDDAALEEYQSAQRGLTRPEIAVLMPYAKNTLYNTLIDSPLPDEGFFEPFLFSYFPDVLQKSYSASVKNHPLRREIIGTIITNQIINRMGGSFIYDLAAKVGRPLEDVVKAYFITMHMYGFEDLWTAIEQNKKLTAENQVALLVRLCRLIRRGTHWVLRHFDGKLDIEKISTQLKPAIDELNTTIVTCFNQDVCNRLDHYLEMFQTLGLDQNTAKHLAHLTIVAGASDIVLIAQQKKASIELISKVYFALGSRFHFYELRKNSEKLPQGTPWQRQAVTAFVEDLHFSQAALTKRVLQFLLRKKIKDIPLDGLETIETWAQSCKGAVSAYEQLLNDAYASGLNQLAIFTVLQRELRGLAG